MNISSMQPNTFQALHSGKLGAEQLVRDAKELQQTQQNNFRALRPDKSSVEQQVQDAKELKETFRTVLGELYFGQLIKSMNSTVGKPAYFHGGQAEEIFRGQLNQTMAQDMAKASADKITDPMFRQQFPKQAELLREATQAAKAQESNLVDLDQLRRR